eukprot:396823-Hanusia_phi.AAC.1
MLTSTSLPPPLPSPVRRKTPSTAMGSMRIYLTKTGAAVPPQLPLPLLPASSSPREAVDSQVLEHLLLAAAHKPRHPASLCCHPLLPAERFAVVAPLAGMRQVVQRRERHAGGLQLRRVREAGRRRGRGAAGRRGTRRGGADCVSSASIVGPAGKAEASASRLEAREGEALQGNTGQGESLRGGEREHRHVRDEQRRPAVASRREERAWGGRAGQYE